MKRDFNAVLKKLDSFSTLTGLPLQHLADVSVNGNSYPILKIQIGSGNEGKKQILISAGIHGDEPAGVETVCDFLQNREFLNYEREWDLTILPCLNPFGYEQGTRNNHEDKDLNRLFNVSSPPTEVMVAHETLKQSFDVTLELHEDSDSYGYYLFQKEAIPIEPSMGRIILQAVEPIMPINLDSKIEGLAADRGLISRFSDPQKMEWWPMAIYSASRKVSLCFTLETAPHFPMETRVRAHICAIRTVLGNYPPAGPR